MSAGGGGGPRLTRKGCRLCAPWRGSAARALGTRSPKQNAASGNVAPAGHGRRHSHRRSSLAFLWAPERRPCHEGGGLRATSSEVRRRKRWRCCSSINAGSRRQLDSSCEIWRVAAVGLVGQLGKVIHIFHDGIITLALVREEV